MITKRQVDVYKALTDMIMKNIIAAVLLVCFCVVLRYLLAAEPTWAKTAPLTALEALMAGSFYRLMPHYFHSKTDSD